jgi:hypothetical protein
MKFAGNTHIIMSLIVTVLSPIFLPIFCQWYEQQTGISPVPIYAIYILIGFVNWILIGFIKADQ